MRITATIPTRGRPDQLRTSACALLADPRLDELVVVVDGGADGSEGVADQLAAGDERVVVLTTAGVGKQRAEQLAVERASGDVVLLVDDDVVATPGLAAGHVAHHEARDGIVVVGYMPVSPTPEGPGRAFAHMYHQDYERIVRGWEHAPDAILHNLWGGNVSLRRDDALRVGVSSPSYESTWRHGDRDFGLRCQKAGLIGVFDRSLLAAHHYGRSLEDFLRDARAQGIGHINIHRLHEDVLGPFDLEDFWRELSWPRAATIRAASTRFGHRPTIAALTLGTRLAARLHRTQDEIVLSRLLMRGEHAFHARRALRGRASHR